MVASSPEETHYEAGLPTKRPDWCSERGAQIASGPTAAQGTSVNSFSTHPKVSAFLPLARTKRLVLLQPTLIVNHVCSPCWKIVPQARIVNHCQLLFFLISRSTNCFVTMGAIVFRLICLDLYVSWLWCQDTVIRLECRMWSFILVFLPRGELSINTVTFQFANLLAYSDLSRVLGKVIW